MTLSLSQLQSLETLAVTAAKAAGAIINSYRDREVSTLHKAVGDSPASQVVTEVDHKAQAAILEILQPTCKAYDLALLTEESPDDGERLEKQAFWSIDPMDGTLAFINNTVGFSVSIGLVARNGTPLIGVVFDPSGHTLYQAVRGQGAYKNDAHILIPEPDKNRPLILRTDFSFKQHPWLLQTQNGLQDIAERLNLNGAEIRFQVGAVQNACEILETPNTCYFKYPRPGNSGGSLWDYAATACLYNEAGGIATDIHGETMELNRPDSTFMNHRGILYAGNSRLAQEIMMLYRKIALPE